MDLSVCQQILVFGGSFNPPHVAHTQLPVKVMETLGADAVVYVPAGHHPLKGPQSDASADHRLAMLKLALQGVPRACILTTEIDRSVVAGRSGAGQKPTSTPAYTVDTLEQLREKLGPRLQMRLLIGGDNLRVFDRWYRSKRIVELAPPAVMVRPPDTREALLASLPKGYQASEWGPRLIDVPRIDVSSTQVRNHTARGGSITGLVLPAVEAYIQQHKLYTHGG